MNLRQKYPSLFDTGEYVPLTVEGPRAQNVCAFLRKSKESTAVVIVPHLVGNILGEDASVPVGEAVWGETTVVVPKDLGICSRLFTGAAVKTSGAPCRLQKP